MTHCFVRDNGLDGIYVESQSLVLANNVKGSDPFPGTNACIRAKNEGNRIEANHVSRHQVGIRIEGNSNLIIRNSAYSNATNYLINAGNSAGPIITDNTFATNTNPHANFEL